MGFRSCFPFGRPEGALKATLSLMERVCISVLQYYFSERAIFAMLEYFICMVKVLMKDIMTPVPPEEVRAVIKKCLENAALINYNKLASEAKVEGQ